MQTLADKPHRQGPLEKQRSRFPKSSKTRRFFDLLSRRLVSLGGITIILSVLAILVFIGMEAAPLLIAPKVEPLDAMDLNIRANLQAGEEVHYFGTEEYQEVGYVITSRGRLIFFSMLDGKILKTQSLDNVPAITAVWPNTRGNRFSLGSSQGELFYLGLDFQINYENLPQAINQRRRIITPQIHIEQTLLVDQEREAILQISHQAAEQDNVTLAITNSGRLIYLAQKASKSLLAKAGDSQTIRKDLTATLPGKPTQVIVDHLLANFYVGMENGQIIHFNISDLENPNKISAYQATATSDTSLTALAFLLGDQSIVIGDAKGNVSVWFLVNAPESNDKLLKRAHQLEPHAQAVTSIKASNRDRSFLTSDKTGTAKLHHATSEQTFLTLRRDDSTAKQIFFAPRANGIYMLHANNIVSAWSLNNPHPETNLKTLFGKVWYEGYEKPEYIYQSTGGSDEFEPKLSLVPLIFGTLKGTLYALLISLPIALMGAIYTSQFMHYSLRGLVKPTVEIMAALPSVVLGFLAGLWLAPVMEKIMPAVLSMLIVVPIISLLAIGLWRMIPKKLRDRFHPGTEILFLIPLLALGAWGCVAINDSLQLWVFQGDFGQWWFESMGARYDQRNALVVGFAMGFAVIPIIFTIAEDSLSNVPRHLISGSLALGATRWQTAIHVVLPTAAPGIFSAIMVGFGRAVGETMIVLMATGNTPIMGWNIFDGFRTLSANIAVEIPEAPYGGTLYRVLFLSALLLFAFTFVVNTAAEIVRIRMRQKYANL